MSPGLFGDEVRVKGVVWSLVVGFCTLAFVTTINVQFDVFLHAGPPIVAIDEFLGFELSWVSCYDRIVVFLNDFGSK